MTTKFEEEAFSDEQSFQSEVMNKVSILKLGSENTEKVAILQLR